MEAHVNEVRKLEEHFDGLQTKHIPRAENSIGDQLSKCATQKLLVEPGTFGLHLNQPIVTPSIRAKKRRKISTGQYFLAELPKVASKNVVENDDVLASEQRPQAESQILVVEVSTPIAKEMPLVLVEPQALAWAQQIVQFLQT